MGSGGSHHHSATTGTGAAAAGDTILIEPLNHNAFNVVNVSEDVVRRFVTGSSNSSSSTSPAAGTSDQQQQQNFLLSQQERAKSLEIEQKLRSELKENQRLNNVLKDDLTRTKAEEQNLREKLQKSEQTLAELKRQVQQQEKTTSASLTVDVNSLQTQTAGLTKGSEEEIRFYQRKMDEILDQQQQWREDVTSKFTDNLSKLEKRIHEHDFVAFCKEAEQAVADCYKKNGRQTLNCSAQAKQFLNCVQLYRSDKK